MESLVAAPFQAIGAGGSMVLNSLRAVKQHLGDTLTTRRRSAMDVLGKQVKSIAADIEADAQWLRAHGMEQVVEGLKASGMEPSEAVSQMGKGGRLEQLGYQYRGVMTDPDVQARMEEMLAKVGKLDSKAGRYAAAAGQLDQDASEVLEPMMERLQDTIGELPVLDAEGGFARLQERLSEIADRLAEMVRRLVSKFSPSS